MLSYRWPGNVRELENVVEQAVVLVSGDTIDSDDLPPEVGGDSGPRDVLSNMFKHEEASYFEM